jgi:oligopeptidase B
MTEPQPTPTTDDLPEAGPISMEAPGGPPRPLARPIARTLWGETVEDPYAWLRGPDDPEVLDHLRAENAWTEAYLAPLAELRSTLFEEIRSRIKETDLSVPVVKDGWAYYSRTVEGSQYPVHCRRPAPADLAGLLDPEPVDEQVLLDENIESEGHEFFELGVFEVSPDHRLLLWAADTIGDETFTLRIRDVEAGVDLGDVIPEVSYGSAWAMDNRMFFYVRHDAAHRPFQLWRHELGADPAGDVLVHTEPDERFFLGVGRDKDDSFIQLGLSSAVTDEVHVLRADRPTDAFRIVEPRRQGVEYSVSHHGDHFVVVTNDGAENFRVMLAPDEDPGREHWQELIPGRDDVMVTGVDVFEQHLVLGEREGGYTQIRVRRWDGRDEHVIEQPEPVSTVGLGSNPEYATTTVRYGYSSMVTPSTVFDYDLDTRERTLLKQQEVLGGVDLSRYRTDRTWAEAPDGRRVPISLVWREDRDRTRPGPCLLYGYGAYEASMEPTFSSSRLSLLDRGFVFAIAHVRGGGELGRRWYLDGKLEAKRNTISDFVAAARHLVDEGSTEAAQLVIRGGSAGGLLVGAAINQAPELFAGVVAQVPFVDCLTTICDPTLPLTVTEWEEWGNPTDSQSIYEVMRSYTPYEQVSPAPYPAVLATAGLNDTRVGFWEPAKWVARLRDVTTSDRPILLWVDLGAGHGGPSGRYDAWHEEARVLAFVLDVVGQAQPLPAGSRAGT